jgi:hypothetical protein
LTAHSQPIPDALARRARELGLAAEAIAAAWDRGKDAVVARRDDRAAFDRGHVCVGAEGDAALYLRSHLADPAAICAGTRGTVSMASFGSNGQFANQLFQYAFLHLYALRAGARVELPAWPFAGLLGRPVAPLSAMRPRLTFWHFEDEEALALWDMDEPPVDIDLEGFFQELPASWRHHRAFVRRLLRLAPAVEDAVARWRAAAVPAGSTLVAIHVRRGDYARADHDAAPQFRPIPIAWYRDWLRATLPTLARPVLYVATDDRPAVLAELAELAPLAPARLDVPQPLPDFLALASADVLAVANSSFSRMAALLGREGQVNVIADPAAGRFAPYDPWADRAFWRRFGTPPDRIRRSLALRLERGKMIQELRGWRRLGRLVPGLPSLAARLARWVR